MYSFVKSYIARKRAEYGGWPLVNGLNPFRFKAIVCLKAVDCLWGVGGWVALGTTFGRGFYNLSDNIIGYVSYCVWMLLLSDVYAPLLFYIVLWLIKSDRAYEVTVAACCFSLCSTPLLIRYCRNLPTWSRTMSAATTGNNTEETC